jgi:hypothetical protein
MITIDRIKQGDGYWYHFPTIDFKFQNRGRAAAFVWQFAIEVIHAEINKMPILNFSSYVKSDTLLIHVTNSGWGDAYDCHIQLEEPILNLLFPESARQYRGAIPSGEKQDIFQFSIVAADARQFEIVKGQFEDLPSCWRFSENRGLSLNAMDASWQCKDSQYKGKEQISTRGNINLTELGFEESLMFLTQYSISYSDATYGAIIDPSRGPYERKYPISRKIPPGDVERFHIMVGSPMSCYLQVRFKFFIDQTRIIESEMFDINIWNPRNSQWHLQYTDCKRQYDPSIFPLTSINTNLPLLPCGHEQRSNARFCSVCGMPIPL